MAIHQIEAPDGKIHEIEAPDDASPEQIMSFFEANYKPEPPAEKGYLEGLADAGGAAITNRGLGLLQTAQDVGLPVNKLFGVTPEKFNEASQSAVANQNKLAEGTGISGAVVGGLADPLNLAPLGKLGKLALPAYGAISGFTGGKDDADGLTGRVGDAGVDAGIAYGTGKAFEVGSKLAAPVARKAAEYIPDSVTDKVSSAADYIAEKLKPTAAGPTINKVREGARYDNVSEMSPQDIGEAVLKGKNETAKTVSEFYDTSRDLGKDITFSSEPFKNKAQSLLDGLPQDTFGTDKGLKIKEALTRFSNDKTVTAADLIDMEKNINKYWNRNADGKYDSLFELKDLIQQKLDSVSGDGTDLFKSAYNKAKQSHKDLNVARFGDNKIVDKLLPEHDFENLADFNRRKLTDNPSEIPDDTMLKLNQFIDKVTTPEEVTAALKMIPAEEREAFVKTALAQKMSKTRRGELITALKNTPWLFTSGWRRPVGAAARVISPTLEDAGAIKTLRKVKKEGFTDATFDKYQKEMAKLREGVNRQRADAQQLKDLAGEMQPYRYAKRRPPPPKPLALPAPENVLSGKSGKTLTESTPEQRANFYKSTQQPAQYKSIPKTTKVQSGKPVDVEFNPRKDILQQFADDRNVYLNTNKKALKDAGLFDEIKDVNMKEFLAKIQSKQYPGDKSAFKKAFDNLDAKKAADIEKPIPRSTSKRKGDDLSKRYNSKDLVYDDVTDTFIDPDTGITVRAVSNKKTAQPSVISKAPNTMEDKLKQALTRTKTLDDYYRAKSTRK